MVGESGDGAVLLLLCVAVQQEEGMVVGGMRLCCCCVGVGVADASTGYMLPWHASGGALRLRCRRII